METAAGLGVALGDVTEDGVAQAAESFAALIKDQGLESLHGAVPALMAVVALCLFGVEAARKGSLQRALLRSLEAAIFISFCVLPSVTRSLFLAFKCESIGHDDLASPPESRMYLSASLNIECNC